MCQSVKYHCRSVFIETIVKSGAKLLCLALLTVLQGKSFSLLSLEKEVSKNEK